MKGFLAVLVAAPRRTFTELGMRGVVALLVASMAFAVVATAATWNR